MPDFIEQLRAQLVILGCPVAPMRRLVREAADHREDLKQAGLAEGLAEAEAEGRANESLGDPVAVAERMMETVRHSSWRGRHCAFTSTCICHGTGERFHFWRLARPMCSNGGRRGISRRPLRSDAVGGGPGSNQRKAPLSASDRKPEGT